MQPVSTVYDETCVGSFSESNNRMPRLGLGVRRSLPIELLQQLVCLIEAPHRVQGATRIRVMLQGHLPIGIPDLGERHPLSRIRGQLQLP